MSPGSQNSSARTPGQMANDNDVQPETRPLSLPSGSWTLLPIIEACDNASLPQGPFNAKTFKTRISQVDKDEELLIPFFVKEGDKQPIGFLRPNVLDALLADNEAAVSKMKMNPCWKVLRLDGSDEHTGASEGVWGVAFNDWLNEEGKEARSDHMDRLARSWKEQGLFPDELKGWRNEQYPIYGPTVVQDNNGSSPLPGGNTAFTIERAASCVFGFATFGVHMTAYVKQNNKYLFWVPRRASTKQTWPSYLDNSVAGGITAGDSPLETIVRECAEEASLPPAFIRRRIRACGAISYIYKGPGGWMQPETEYSYDLEMPIPPERAAPSASVRDTDSTGDKQTREDGFPGFNQNDEPVVLRPNDGEAESFSLMSADEVLERMLKKEFKVNCALILVDFFIRHGLLTAESDPSFLEINQRLKQSLHPLSGPA